MPKKNIKKKRNQIPIPKKILSPQERIAGYKKVAFISNLAITAFSALYIIGLHLPYLYPGKITSGEITGSISAMDFFWIPLVYQSSMALVCSLSILSIVLEKSFTWIMFPFVFICLPELSFHLVYTGNEIIFISESFSVFGVGYFILGIAMLGILIFMVNYQFNERYCKPSS